MQNNRTLIPQLIVAMIAALLLQSTIALSQTDDNPSVEVLQECRHELVPHNSIRYLGLAMEYEDCGTVFANAIDEHHSDYGSIPKTDHPEHCRILSKHIVVDVRCEPGDEICPDVF